MLKIQPFQHLYQHVKQDDPRLYETLDRIVKALQDLNDAINKLEDRVKALE